MIRNGEGAMGMLWLLFFATFQSHDPHRLSRPAKITHMDERWRVETVFSRRFQRTVHIPNPCAHCTPNNTNYMTKNMFTHMDVA